MITIKDKKDLHDDLMKEPAYAKACAALEKMAMARIGIVIEKGEHNYGAYAPDVPGCVATGDTLEEVQRVMLDALRFHLEDAPGAAELSIYVASITRST